MAGPWEKYGGQTAPVLGSDPIVKPRDPYKDEDQAMQREANARAAANADRQAEASERAATAAERANMAASRLSVADNEALRRKISAFAKLYQSAQTFRDDYSGLGAGLENAAQAYSPIPVGTPGQRDWWSDFKAADNIIRNELFGASLSGGEKSAYGETTVEPGMNPGEVRRNITRRVEEARAEMGRLVNSLQAAGYNREQIDALMGEYGPIIMGKAPEAEKKDDREPPAVAATTPSADTPPSKPMNALEAGNIPGAGARPETLATDYTEKLDPTRAGIREGYLERLQRGDDAESVVSWLQRVGINHPTTLRQAREQVEFRKRYPKVPMEAYDVRGIDHVRVPLSAGERMINSVAQSPLGAGAIAAGDAMTGFSLDSLIGATGGNAERARLGMDQIAERNPIASALGTIGGAALAAEGVEAGLAVKGLAGVGRTFAADALYGAGAGAGAADTGEGGRPATIGDRLVGAGIGAVGGLAGSYLGGKVAGGLSKIATGTSNPAVRTLGSEGIPLTVGQQLGQSGRVGAAIKGVEDRLSGLPVIGDVVNARRTEGLQAFNRAAFDRALKPIGGVVGDKTGEAAIGEAWDQVGDAYNRALAGKAATADPQFATELTKAVTGAAKLPRIGAEVLDGLKAVLEPYMAGPVITGEALQQISRELRGLKASYASDPLSRRIGSAIDQVEDSVFGMFKRQAPEVVENYDKARTAARRLYILEEAVLKARNTEGTFTPAQLGMADRAGTTKFGGKTAAASGDTPFFDLQRAGQSVLPNRVPDSGTAGRLLVPAIALGGGAAADQYGNTGGVGLTLGAILAGAYSKAGQRVLTKPGRGMSGKAGKVLTDPKTKRIIQGAGAAAGAITATQ